VAASRDGGPVSALASGSPLAVRVTLPEGYTVAQMAVRFEEEAGIPVADFVKAATDSSGNLLEGHLFPDTYEVLYAGDAAEVVARMVERLASVLPRIGVPRRQSGS